MSGNVNEFGITHLRHVDLAVPDFETPEDLLPGHLGPDRAGKDGNLSYFAAEARRSSTSSGCDTIVNDWSARDLQSREMKIGLGPAKGKDFATSVVKPGDLLASGTTGGGGCLAEPWGRSGTQDPPPLEVGDRVVITVERLGTLAAEIALAG